MAVNCKACGGEPRGIGRQRSWSVHPLVSVPRKGPGTPDSLIAHAGVYRNGGGLSGEYLCDSCIATGIRTLKVAIDRALDEVDATTDHVAEIARLTARVSRLQWGRHQACCDHDRMQERLAAVVSVVEALTSGQPAPKSLAAILDDARYEVEKRTARESYVLTDEVA